MPRFRIGPIAVGSTGATGLDADMPEEYRMFQTGAAELSGDVFGLPVSIRADVGDWYQEASLGIGAGFAGWPDEEHTALMDRLDAILQSGRMKRTIISGW